MKKIFYILLSLLFTACSTSTNVSKDNYADVYVNEPSVLKPTYKVFHKTESTSEVFFELNPEELLYIRGKGDSTYQAELRLQYKLYENYTSKVILDSAAIFFIDQTHDKEGYHVRGNFTINAESGNDYILELALKDINRQQLATDMVEVDKTNAFNRQNFKVYNNEEKLSLKNYFKGTEELSIKYNGELDRVHGLYYSGDFPYPPPPFSQQQPKSFQFDQGNGFILQASSGNQFTFKPEDQGNYHFRVDSSQKEGLTIFNFGPTFPKIKNIDQMIPPLRYITTKNEFRVLNDSENPKKALDEFWVKIGGSHERGKKLIKEYYNRVENANKFFTSFVRGWKSDRGLIYIVFGPPNIVHKSPEGETWVYGEENNMLSITFTFFKVKNPFTDNDYELNRSSVFKNSWYRAVESWRQGRVF